MISNKFFLATIVVILININFLSASFGFDNIDIPSLNIPTATGNVTYNQNITNTYNIINESVNLTDYSDIALTNQSNDFGAFNQTTTGWWNGLFNWVINSVSSAWLQFDGSTLTFNESHLNETIGNYVSNLTNQAGNSSWNQSFADTLYSPIGTVGGNESFNESYTDNKYVNVAGDTMNGNLTLNGSDVKITDATDTIRMYYEEGALVVGWD